MPIATTAFTALSEHAGRGDHWTPSPVRPRDHLRRRARLAARGGPARGHRATGVPRVPRRRRGHTPSWQLGWALVAFAPGWSPTASSPTSGGCCTRSTRPRAAVATSWAGWWWPRPPSCWSLGARCAGPSPPSRPPPRSACSWPAPCCSAAGVRAVKPRGVPGRPARSGAVPCSGRAPLPAPGPRWTLTAACQRPARVRPPCVAGRGVRGGGAGARRAGPARADQPAVAGGDLRPLRLALVLGTSTGGVGRHVAALAAGLAARRVTTCWWSARRRPTAPFGFGHGRGGVPRRGVRRPAPARRRRWSRSLRLRALLAGADVVHAHGLRAGGSRCWPARPAAHGRRWW